MTGSGATGAGAAGVGAAGEPEIRVLDDPEATSRAAAETIAGALRDAVERRGRADWATTGGSTPTGIYRELAVAPLRDEVPWDRVHVWWGDDRYVPRDHPLSNVLPLDQVLVSMSARAGLSGSGADAAEVDLGIEPGAPIPAANIHAPNVDHALANALGPEWVAEEYERRLREGGLETDDAGFPIFDVVFLGLGPDGHVLSAFPGSRLFDTDAWVAAVPAPTHVEPHVARVSLNPGVVRAARLPLVVAHGAGKAAMVAAVLGASGDDRDERRFPALIARRSGATWFLDRAAAASLPR
jgi:6-phosphogluconolactonase/glucosamine-6-phosphate isomerase/deaminase